MSSCVLKKLNVNTTGNIFLSPKSVFIGFLIKLFVKIDFFKLNEEELVFQKTKDPIADLDLKKMLSDMG